MKYTLGAIKNIPDIRDVPLTAVQTPVSVPDSYITDISMIPVLNQGSLGSCVGHAHAVIHTYLEYLETKSIKNFSPRYLYALSKKLDGYSSQGTYPRLTNSIMTKNGCALTDTVPNDTTLSHETYIDVKETAKVTKQAEPYKIKGYVSLPNNKEAIKQALYQNKLIAMSIHVGDYNHAPMKKGDIGSHRVIGFGYETVGNDLKIYCRNSWGEQWGDKGNFFIMWSDFKEGIDDINTYTDIPNEVLDEYKTVDVIITRKKDNGKQTLGKLVAKRNGATFTCDTLELPWKNNEKNVSCVPKGMYDVKYTFSWLFKKYTYEIQKVLNRTGIRKHAGNYYTQIQGCILLGVNPKDINGDGQIDVTNSRATVKSFEQFMGKKPYRLLIK